MKVSERINELINQKGLKQCRVAEMASLTPGEFNHMLCGRKIIRAEHIPNICVALNVTPNELFKGTGSSSSR